MTKIEIDNFGYQRVSETSIESMNKTSITDNDLLKNIYFKKFVGEILNFKGVVDKILLLLNKKYPKNILEKKNIRIIPLSTEFCDNVVQVSENNKVFFKVNVEHYFLTSINGGAYTTDIDSELFKKIYSDFVTLIKEHASGLTIIELSNPGYSRENKRWNDCLNKYAQNRPGINHLLINGWLGGTIKQGKYTYNLPSSVDITLLKLEESKDTERYEFHYRNHPSYKKLEENIIKARDFFIFTINILNKKYPADVLKKENLRFMADNINNYFCLDPNSDYCMIEHDNGYLRASTRGIPILGNLYTYEEDYEKYELLENKMNVGTVERIRKEFIYMIKRSPLKFVDGVFDNKNLPASIGVNKFHTEIEEYRGYYLKLDYERVEKFK
jgi:hypothetical protein